MFDRLAARLPPPATSTRAAPSPALEDVLRRRRQAEVDDLELVLQWCRLHSAEPYVDVPGGERLDGLGGDGTPAVKELAIVELGVARGVHTLAARAVVADALDLGYRLPLVSSRVRELQGEARLARKIATLTRKLSYEQVAVVDQAMAVAIGGQARPGSSPSARRRSSRPTRPPTQPASRRS